MELHSGKLISITLGLFFPFEQILRNFFFSFAALHVSKMHVGINFIKQAADSERENGPQLHSQFKNNRTVSLQ